MKKITKIKAMLLALMMLLGLIAPMTATAQKSDGFFKSGNDNYQNRATTGIDDNTSNGGIQNDPFGAPLGSGLLILTVVGVGYAVAKRRRNFIKGTTLLFAALMLLGMTACRKKIVEPIAQPTAGNQVAITLNVGDGAKAEVTPPNVAFEPDDKILVASGGHYVGTLTYNGGIFGGNITDPVENQPLYFYFLGNKQGTLTVGDEGCTVDISDQTNYPHLPVISMGVSIDRSQGNEIVYYKNGETHYEAQLHNKASLIKFNVTTPSNSPICITGMNNQVTVDFDNLAENEGFSYGKVNNEGIIKLKGGSGTNVEKWAIVLQQDELTEGAAGSAYTEDGAYVGALAAVPAITMNQFIDANRPMTVTSQTPLTIEAITAGTVNVQYAPSGMKYSKNGEAMKSAQDYPSITVAVGDKVRFYGNGTSITNYNGTKISGGSAQVKAYGNIMSLVDETGYATATTLSSDNAFYGFFQNNSTLTDASGLLLPAMTLTKYCYNLMFQNCTALTAAPAELPATTLFDRCYNGMFNGCTNLVTAPEIKASTLDVYCCNQMFYNCSNLETAPVLNATTLASNCYNQMFRSCSKLSSVTCLATDISANKCLSNWLYDAGTSATSKTLYVKSTMGSASWNNASFTVSATL